MVNLNECKAKILNKILPKIDTDKINICVGNESIEIATKNTPIIILHSELCEYGIVPLSQEYVSILLGDTTQKEKIPYEINGAILEKLLAPKIEELSKLINSNIEITEYRDYSKENQFQYFVDFMLNIDCSKSNDDLSNIFDDQSKKIPLRFLIKNDTCLDTLIDKVSQLQDYNIFDIDILTVDLKYLLGYTVLSIDELKSLKIGDALVPEKFYFSDKNLLVTNDELYFNANCDEDLSNITLTNCSNPIDIGRNMVDNNQDIQVDVSELNVNVQFVLDTVPINIKDLSGLKSGSVLPINNKDLSNIDIVVNNQKIGKGRVISVNDEYLIQITNFNKK